MILSMKLFSPNWENFMIECLLYIYLSNFSGCMLCDIDFQRSLLLFLAFIVKLSYDLFDVC